MHSARRRNGIRPGSAPGRDRPATGTGYPERRTKVLSRAKIQEWIARYQENPADPIPEDPVRAFIFGYLRGHVDAGSLSLPDYLRLRADYGFESEADMRRALAPLQDALKWHGNR